MMEEDFGEHSLLWIAVLAGYTYLAELFVRSGADVNEIFGSHDPQVIDEKWTILHELIQMDPSTENERLIRLVIGHGADLHARDSRGQTVLHYAVEKSRVEITEMLLEKGADVNAADNEGMTPLLLAACFSNKANEVVPLLIEHEADIFAKSRDGSNVLHFLCQTPEHLADLARFFIGKGVSVDNKAGPDLCQPIHYAAFMGKDEEVKLFLNHGVDVNALTEDLRSPLHEAVWHMPESKVAETLLKRGANINLRNIDGHTALYVVCEAAEACAPLGLDSWKPSIELLLSAGADMLIEDNNGKTPFSLISSLPNVMEESSTRLMIGALAMKKVCQPSIELKDERIIERNPEMWMCYRECIDMIKRMKTTSFIETCTFFELLTKCHCQIAARMRNPEFEISFENYDLTEFSIYAEDIRRAFERGKNHYSAMVEQENAINEAYGNTLPVLVVDKVVRYVLNCCVKY